MGEVRLVAEPSKTAEIWVPEETWCQRGGIPGTRHSLNKEKEQGKSKACKGLSIEHSPESPLHRGAVEGTIRNTTLSQTSEAFKCQVSVFLLFSR